MPVGRGVFFVMQNILFVHKYVEKVLKIKMKERRLGGRKRVNLKKI